MGLPALRTRSWRPARYYPSKGTAMLTPRTHSGHYFCAGPGWRRRGLGLSRGRDPPHGEPAAERGIRGHEPGHHSPKRCDICGQCCGRGPDGHHVSEHCGCARHPSPGYVLKRGLNPIHHESASLGVPSGCTPAGGGGGGCAVHGPSLAGHPAGRYPDLITCG